MRLLMIFLDGVGIGRRDPTVNPFFAAKLPALRSILAGELPSLGRSRIRASQSTLLPLNATLGVSGLPQSGTGQTALFTGENGARIIGKHFGPYPYSTLRPLIVERNIFRRLLHQGKQPIFANAYPRRFFEYVERHPTRLTVTTYSCLQSGVRLLGGDDLAAGRGISADITGVGWLTLGYPTMPVIAPEAAGRRLVRLLDNYDFVLFEYWRTDKAGHSRQMAEAVHVLDQLDGLLEGVLEAIDPRRQLLFITSDHGNVEDLATRSHTRHPVPGVMYGHRQGELADRLQGIRARGPCLCDVTPALLSMLTEDG
jgi:hypothetical protein